MARANATCKVAIMKKKNKWSGLVTWIRELGRNPIQEIKQRAKLMFTAEQEGERVEVLLLVSQKWTSIKFDTGED